PPTATKQGTTRAPWITHLHNQTRTLRTGVDRYAVSASSGLGLSCPIKEPRGRSHVLNAANATDT
ncbi:MAG: hypothetical protein QF435_10820, partial [Arenicellales bacterium]|nr:hypothetical protein [Arenicellales bacterium]